MSKTDAPGGPRVARLWILCAAVLFSTGGAGIKLTALAPAQVASFRCCVAFATLILLSRDARRRPNWRYVLVGLAYASTMLLFVLANKSTTAANTVFLQSTAPLYLVVLAPLLLHERIRASDLAVLLVMAVGLVLFFADPVRPQTTAPEPAFGNVLAALGGLTWGLTVLGLRWLGRRGESVMGAVLMGNLLAFLAAFPFALPVAQFGLVDGLVILWLGVFQISLAYVCAGQGLRTVPAFEASLLFLAEPVLSPVWALLLFGERSGVWALAGGALILTATVGRAWFARPKETVD